MSTVGRNISLPVWTVPPAENQDCWGTPDEHVCFPLAQECVGVDSLGPSPVDTPD